MKKYKLVIQNTFRFFVASQFVFSTVVGQAQVSDYNALAPDQSITSENTRLGLQGAQIYDYNPGPDPMTIEGRQFIDWYSNLPEYSVMSDELMDDQKFRFTYGTMATRTRFEKNAVKIFFIGQDATHIAEASKQPGTSGFGGRVQSLANFFGVDQSVATTNAYLSTIKGQYGSADHPYVEISANGEMRIARTTLVDNQLWALTHDENSEIRKSREAFFEWMIKNNPESLRLMVLFGGAAKDAFAQFLIARGAEVPTRLNPERLKNIKVPTTKIVNAGGNATFPVLLTKEGKDLYEVLLQDHPDFKKFQRRGGRGLDYSKPEVQKAAEEVLKTKKSQAIEMMAFTAGGKDQSGVIDAAQLGGYDLSRAKIDGKQSNSLAGLRLSDGTIVTKNLAFVESIHPTALSRLAMSAGVEAASKKVRESLAPLEKLQAEGWVIEPDVDSNGKKMVNSWHQGDAYDYGRGEVHACYFECGAPSDRRANTSSATRDGVQVILAGTVNRGSFDEKALEDAQKGMPSEILNPDDLWTVRQRVAATRYIFDRGPGKLVAKKIFESLDQEKLFALKPGYQRSFQKNGIETTFQKNGIEAYYTQTNRETGLFGFHRGSFSRSEALILADPQGMDDWNTSRALTGARGQYLHRMMSDLGIPEKYLVIKSVPVGMDGATAQDWEYVRSVTEKYREVAIEEALKSGKVKYFFADGAIASAELTRILKKLNLDPEQIVHIQRDQADPRSGIIEARALAQKKLGLAKGQSFDEVLKMKDIPRSHLTWWSRLWEGTSGDRVIEARGKERGGARALVAPDWITRQVIRPHEKTTRSIQLIKEKFERLGLRLGNERIAEFLKRKQLTGRFDELKSKGAAGFTEQKSAPLEQKSAPQCHRIFVIAG